MSDYDDDFEQYDDDEFEAEDDTDAYDVLPKSMLPRQATPSPEPPKQAVRPPSASLYQQQNRPASVERPLDIPPQPVLSDVEMRARRKRLALARQKMKNVQLQVVAIEDVFQLASLSQYELYSMARGTYAQLKVAAVQTNDDAKEEECQTDEVPSQTQSCQVPDDRNKMSEAEVAAVSVDAGAASTRAGKGAKPVAPAGSAAARLINMEPGLELRLAAFMRWAGPTMLAALGMAPGSHDLSFAPPPKGNSGLGSGLIHLGWDELLAHRPVTSLSFSTSPIEPLLVVAYGPVGAQLGAAELIKDHSLAAKGCLCVWELSNPSRPKHVCFSEGAPSCCAFAPAPASHLVFAGMQEGGVCAWDLEEPASRHPQELVGGGESVAGRRPSYTTEGSTGAESRVGPITGVATVMKEGGGRSTPCSLVATTGWGEVAVYTVSLLASAEGSTTGVDLGMRIGSRVRLLRNAGIVRLGMAALLRPRVDADAALPVVPVNCLALLRGQREGGQLLVGSEGGRVLRGSWVGTPPAPKEYLAEDSRSSALTSSAAAAQLLTSAVTCIATSPFQPKAFVVGHSNGTIALHCTQSSASVAMWPELGQGAIQAVAWSPTRPLSFLALDAACVVYIFDMTQTFGQVVHQEAFMAQGPHGVASLTTCLAAMAFTPGGRAAAPVPVAALGYDDGTVDVHVLNAQFAQSSQGVDAELAVLNDMLGITRTEAAAAS